MEILGHQIDIAAGILPLDLQTARSGDYVSLKNAEGCLVVILKGVGTASDDPTFTLRKATAVDGTGVTNAAVIDTVYVKEGTLSAVTGWTKSAQTAAATYAASATSAESEALYAFHVRADSLGAYDCIQVNCADVGSNAQLGCVLYILYGLRNAATPASLPDPLTD